MEPEEIDALVKARVDDGAIENDEGDTQVPEVDPETVDAYVDEIRKGLDAYDDDADELDDQPDLFKAFDSEPDVVDGDDQTQAVVLAMAKSTDAIVARGDRMVKALSAGMIGLAEQNAELTKAVNTLSQLAGAQATRLDAIEKAVKVPVVPRSLLGAAAVPSPADKAGVDADRPKLKKSVETKAIEGMRLAKSTGDVNRVAELRKAVSELSNIGSDPTEIATKYGLA
jgi:hypothetical protein